MNRLFLPIAATFLVAGVALTATAQLNGVIVQLDESKEVPPHKGQGAGTATLTLSEKDKSVTWKITWHDLSSDAIMAHIHGPALPGKNAGVIVNLAPNGMKMPLEGTAKLSDAQWRDLLAGKDYINVHTDKNKGGEIRGQIVVGKISSSG
jgi:hypothetical protein